jgi:hypothetical protein
MINSLRLLGYINRCHQCLLSQRLTFSVISARTAMILLANSVCPRYTTCVEIIEPLTRLTIYIRFLVAANWRTIDRRNLK